MLVRLPWGLIEGGLTEIIDKDDAEVAAQEYSKSVSVTLDKTFTTNTELQSGEIRSMLLVASELGSGAVLTTAGRMYIFDADPAVSAGDSALAAAGAEHKTLIGIVHFESTDWDSDANGGMAYKHDITIPFHRVDKLYFVFRPDAGSTAINSAAGDDEELHFNFWYERLL